MCLGDLRCAYVISGVLRRSLVCLGDLRLSHLFTCASHLADTESCCADTSRGSIRA